jgi:hypothetical protein
MATIGHNIQFVCTLQFLFCPVVAILEVGSEQNRKYNVHILCHVVAILEVGSEQNRMYNVHILCHVVAILEVDLNKMRIFMGTN